MIKRILLPALAALTLFVGGIDHAFACDRIEVSVMESGEAYAGGGFVQIFTFDGSLNNLALGEVGSDGTFSSGSLGNLGTVVAMVSPYKHQVDAAPVNGHAEFVTVDGSPGVCGIELVMEASSIVDVQLSAAGPFAIAL